MTHEDRRVSREAPLLDRIGRYQVTGRLGKGSMGVVYSASDPLMGREVAIKVLMADLHSDPTTLERFRREAQAAGRLFHRNIVAVFDVGDDDDRPFIVMELLKGKTLSDFVRSTADLRIDQKVDLMIQVCEGLQAAHAQGIYHRDIKPGNLYVLNDGTVKILDFSVARLAASTLTAQGAVIGTPDFMAPEQALGREVDQRSDIFSAAAVFYYILSGRKPFTGATLPLTFHNVQLEDPPALAEHDAPPALAAIIVKGLAKQPSDRFQTALDMSRELARFRRDYEAHARAVSAAPDALQAGADAPREADQPADGRLVERRPNELREIGPETLRMTSPPYVPPPPEPAVARFAVYDEDAFKGEVEVSEQGVSIGRAETNDVVLLDATRSVSRVHARIVYEDGCFAIVDQNSQNGTWMGGERVERAVVRTDDEIMIGDYKFVCVEAPLAAGHEAADSARKVSMKRRLGWCRFRSFRPRQSRNA